ncbi:MAG: Sapep family Mn(2+)-dependent dipeptidase [Eggerthellaceae bacterium]|jgi:succinyl-diaminopimelate desuccinylase
MFYHEGLLAEAQEFADREWPKVEADLADLVAIDSAKGVPDEGAGAPYGPGPRKALDAMLAKAEAYGLVPHDGGGHMGYADAPGAGTADTRKQLAIIGHLDTVPAGDGWSSDPHTLALRDGLYVGRGVSDDKGPLTCALHAVRFWMERTAQTGECFPHDLRMLFGCDEESGMGDADWYLAHHEAPDFLFTPDAEFPVCYGEKGQFQARIVSKPIADGALVSLSAGEAVNAIPGVATAVVRVQPGRLPAASCIEVAPCPDRTAGSGESTCSMVTAHGIAGHAAMPEGAVNALHLLASYLVEAGVLTADETQWLAFVRDITGQTDGAYFGMQISDADFGPLTCVAGMARLAPEAGEGAADAPVCRFTQSIDCRFPTGTTAEELRDKVAATVQAAGLKAQVEPLSLVEPLIVDPDTAPVQALRRAYALASGVDAAPVTMGGGTYAHHFPRGTSFGAEDLARFPRPSWAGGMHAVDEAVPVAELKQALVAYILAIALLMDGDLS